MNEIIRAEYIKQYGHYETPAWKGRYHEWNFRCKVFTDGWKVCEEWHERQNMMDRDSLEQTKEEAKLAGGLG